MTFDHLSAFRGGKPILSDLSFSLTPQTLTVLLGRNGSGKSTLLQCVNRQLRYQGNILLEGRPLTDLSPREQAKRIALLPQLLPTPDLTVERLTAMGRSPYLSVSGRLSQADRTAVEDALSLTELRPLRHRPLATLSGGERQRAYLAMILAQDTDYLLLDEPTAYLDQGATKEFLQLLKELTARRGKTVLAVLHDLNAATAYADRLLLLNHGRLIEPDQIEQVFGVEKTLAADGTYFYR